MTIQECITINQIKMKTSIYFVTSLIAFTLLLFACGSKDQGKDQKAEESITSAREVSPKVVFDNDYVKVLKVTLAPAESLQAHEGEKRLIYSLSDYSIDWVERGKNEGTRSWKKGNVHFHEAGSHAARNIGESTAEWLVFVRKGTKLPDCPEQFLEKDVHVVTPEVSRQLFDNDHFRMTEVNLPQGGSIPMHSGLNRVIYSLSGYQILYESDKEGKVERSFKPGDVHWHGACQHALENTGKTEARFLVVSYK